MVGVSYRKLEPLQGPIWRRVYAVLPRVPRVQATPVWTSTPAWKLTPGLDWISKLTLVTVTGEGKG